MKKTKSKSFKYCLVPLCKSTTFQTPNKIFIKLPFNPHRRNEWLKACRRDIRDISLKSVVFVCEDHFNLEEDMENYIRFKLMGGKKTIKEGVVPHIFHCHPGRKRTWPTSVTAPKMTKRHSLQEPVICCSTTTEQVQNEVLKYENKREKKEVETQTLKNISPKRTNKSVQCKIYGSVTVSLSPLKTLSKDIGTSPKRRDNSNSDSGLSSFKSEKNSEEYCNTCESDSLSSIEKLQEERIEEFKSLVLRSTFINIEKRPTIYLGLPDFAFFILKLLQNHCKIPNKHIYLTLKKIRTGHSFTLLADDFGMSEGYASKIFEKSLPNISKYLRTCIIKPNIKSVKVNLPTLFRAHYSNVYCIMNCLEIEIEKPSDAVKQFLTWSEYKKCNTLKYLISCTPDGIINFISTGFSGHTSDAIIVEYSGFLNILPPGVDIMADKGFKNIEHLLVAKHCKLIRPPSISAGIKSTKSEVFEKKKIASLKMYVERVIHRLQEYAFLTPRAYINDKLIPHTDHIIKIACGLINLQSGAISGQ